MRCRRVHLLRRALTPKRLSSTKRSGHLRFRFLSRERLWRRKERNTFLAGDEGATVPVTMSFATLRYLFGGTSWVSRCPFRAGDIACVSFANGARPLRRPGVCVRKTTLFMNPHRRHAFQLQSGRDRGERFCLESSRPQAGGPRQGRPATCPRLRGIFAHTLARF